MKPESDAITLNRTRLLSRLPALRFKNHPCDPNRDSNRFGAGNDCAAAEGSTPAGPESSAAPFEFSGSLTDDLEFLEFGDDTTPEQVQSVLDNYGAQAVSFMGSDLEGVYRADDGTLVEWDGESNYFTVTSPEDVGQFVYDRNLDQAIADYEDNFNREFWDSPGPVFHATPSENRDSIAESGIGAAAETRGMTNRSEGAAVYTTSEWDEAQSGSYGDLVLEIDTAAMKRDGHAVRVALEPDVVEGELRSALASALGDDYFSYDYESGMSPNTIVFQGNIPAKYVKFHDSRLKTDAATGERRMTEWLAAIVARLRESLSAAPGGLSLAAVSNRQRLLNAGGAARFKSSATVDECGASGGPGSRGGGGFRDGNDCAKGGGDVHIDLDELLSPEERQEFTEWLNGDRGEVPLIGTDRQILSPEFKEWFGESQVVGPDGRPLPVYHGTTAEFTAFDIAKAKGDNRTDMLGIFTTNEKKVAWGFSVGEGKYDNPEGHVKKLYMRMEKPFVIEDFADHYTHEAQPGSLIGKRVRKWHAKNNTEPFNQLRDFIRQVANKDKWADVTAEDVTNFRKHMMSRGYDGIIVKDTVMDAGGAGHQQNRPVNTFYIAFSANQVKSAEDNEGSYRKDDDDIRKSATFSSKLRTWRRKTSGCGAGKDGDPGFEEGNTCATGGRGKRQPNGVENIGGTDVVVNPSRAQAKKWLERSKYKELRGIIIPDTQDMYLWDAAHSGHDYIATMLGYTGDERERMLMGNARIYVKNPGQIDIMWDRFQDTGAFRPKSLKSACGAGETGDPGFQAGNTCAKRGMRRYALSEGGVAALDRDADDQEQKATDKVSPERKKLVDAFIRKFQRSADSNFGIAPDRLEEYVATAQQVAEKMTDTMLQRANENTLGVSWYKHVDDLTLKFMPKKDLSEKGRIGGAWVESHQSKGHLHLDGPFESGSQLRELDHLYAHEFGHAFDGNPGGSQLHPYRIDRYGGDPVRPGSPMLSDTRIWSDAHLAEIDTDDIALSKYAQTSHSEGFAEYARLVLTDPDTAREKFPKCWRAWQKFGLLEDD